VDVPIGRVRARSVHDGARRRYWHVVGNPGLGAHL